MARIVLGIGTSHTPMLNVGPEDWPRFEELDRKRKHLHRDGRPATYDELLAIAPSSLRANLVPESLPNVMPGRWPRWTGCMPC